MKSIIKLSNKKAQIENFSLNVEKSKNIFNMKPINMTYEIKKYSISRKNL